MEHRRSLSWVTPEHFTSMNFYKLPINIHVVGWKRITASSKYAVPTFIAVMIQVGYWGIPHRSARHHVWPNKTFWFHPTPRFRVVAGSSFVREPQRLWSLLFSPYSCMKQSWQINTTGDVDYPRIVNCFGLHLWTHHTLTRVWLFVPSMWSHQHENRSSYTVMSIRQLPIWLHFAAINAAVVTTKYPGIHRTARTDAAQAPHKNSSNM